MTVVENLEDELVLYRDFERVDASERPRTKREARHPRIQAYAEAVAGDARGPDPGLARGAFGGEGGRGDPRPARGAPAARKDDSPARARDRCGPRPQPLPDLRLDDVEGESIFSTRGAGRDGACPQGRRVFGGGAVAAATRVACRRRDRAVRAYRRRGRACHAEATSSCGRPGGARVAGVLLRRRTAAGGGFARPASAGDFGVRGEGSFLSVARGGPLYWAKGADISNG